MKIKKMQNWKQKNQKQLKVCLQPKDCRRGIILMRTPSNTAQVQRSTWQQQFTGACDIVFWNVLWPCLLLSTGLETLQQCWGQWVWIIFSEKKLFPFQTSFWHYYQSISPSWPVHAGVQKSWNMTWQTFQLSASCLMVGWISTKGSATLAWELCMWVKSGTCV